MLDSSRKLEAFAVRPCSLLRTVRAPCSGSLQVFEQLIQEMVWERSCRWYLLGSEALPFPLIGSG